MDDVNSYFETGGEDYISNPPMPTPNVNNIHDVEDMPRIKEYANSINTSSEVSVDYDDASSTVPDDRFNTSSYYKDRSRINEELIKLQNKQKILDKVIENIKEKALINEKNALKVESNMAEAQAFYKDLQIKNINIESKVLDFQSELKESRNSFLGIIALFASFFSFISVSINIFSKEMTVATSISIVIVLWVCLVSFIFIFMASLSKGFVYFSSASIIRHFLVVIVCIVIGLIIPRFVMSFMMI
ncbi:hypothetical protein ACNSPD_07780 [Yersinia enterocolitica]|uniref:hypothetical protein n=1 Tax=Yersinia TaxID=629 RepID=UPI003AB25E87